ncbi:MAG: tetratricopeptide repeat protein [bacterium]
MRKIIVLLLIITSGCAYFNTFYNARYYYEKAVKPLENNQKPNTGYLDKAIEKSSKILQFHPQSRYVEEALMIIGKSYMYKGEYTKAIRKFEELERYYPDSRYTDEMVYFKAMTYREQGENRLAELYFRQLIEQGGPFASKSMFSLTEMYIEGKQFQEALELLESGGELSNESKMLYLNQKVYFENKQYSKAIDISERIDFDDLQSLYRFNYISIYITSLIETGHYDRAGDLIDRYLKYFPDNRMKNSLYLKKTDVLRNKDRREEALALIEDITAQRSVPLKDSILFRRGEILESLERYEEAQTAYNRIKEEMRGSIMEPEVDLKLMSLGLYEEISRDSIVDTDKIAKNRFLLAEINYLNLKNIESAEHLYSTVKDSYPDSYYAPKSLYALGIIFMKEKGDTSEALKYFERILSDYPDAEIYFETEDIVKRIKNESNSEE